MHAGGTLSRSLVDALRVTHDADAIVDDDNTWTYGTLLQSVTDWQAYLQDVGVVPGRVVALEAAYSPHSCAALVALISLGAIVVPLSALPEAKRNEFLEVAQV